MEYPVSNVSLDRNAQGDYYSQTVGDYDLWAIQYGYMPVDEKTSQDEAPALRKIADLAAQPGHEYGTDEDAFPGPIPMGVDPDITQFDLGADPVAYARARLALIRTVRGKIQAYGTAEGESYDRVRNTFDSLMTAQSQALQIVAKQVGGLSTSRSHKGDPGQRPAFTMVPPARQREAMKVIAESGFADAAWSVPPGLLDSLQPNHWWHWGIDLAKSVPFDYPYTDRILDIQAAVLDYVMHPVMLSRIAETETAAKKGESYTLAEHLRGITDSTFSELGPKSAAAGAFGISPIRRNLDRAVLDRLIILTNTPPAGTPDDARSLARANLVTVEKRIGSVLLVRAAGMDEATKAFLDESRARIKRALAAQTVVMG
jgi:hypothetical protein